MGTSPTESVVLLVANQTGEDGPRGHELGEGLLAFKILNITLVSLALIIFIVTTIICSISYHKRSRLYKRAREYEHAVRYTGAGKPIDITGIKRVLSIRKPLILMRKQEILKDTSQIYFIYDNPTMAAVECDCQEIEAPQRQGPINPTSDSTMQSTGIILNPRVFYV